MADQKKKRPKLASPRGVAAYAWLDKKDTMFANGDESKAKYKLSLLLEKGVEVNDAFVKALAEKHKAAGGKPSKGLGIKALDGDLKEDKEGNPKADFANMWVVPFASTKYKPKQVDSKKQPLPASVRIFSGDVVKVAFTENEYEGFGGGMNLYLEAVMLLEKRNDGGDAVSAFGDDEEGYVAPAEAFEDKVDETGDDSNGDF